MGEEASEEASDEYERKYMQPGERLVFREKVVSRTAFRLAVAFGILFGAAGLFATITALTAPGAIGALSIGLPFLALAAFMVLGGIAFSVFRSMVTSSHVHIHFGWAKRRIAMDAIDDVKVVKLSGFKQGKVSMGFDGVVRTWVGNSASGRGVELTYRDGKQKHVLTIGSERPERFVEAIEATRATARGGEAKRGRIVASDDEAAAGEAAAAEEAAAEVEATAAAGASKARGD